MDLFLLETGNYSQKNVSVKPWIALILLLLQFKGFSNADCVASLECISIEQCKKLLGIKTNSFILFPCDNANRGVCCPIKQNAPVSIKDKMTLLPLDICGVSTADRITGGEDADPGQFPWMALLGYKVADSDVIEFLCGGSIINDHYILTAAHCLRLEGAQLVSVRLGERKLATDPDCEPFCPPAGCQSICSEPVQDYEVESTKAHEKFSSATLKNDIALIRLKRSITTFQGEFIRPVCLPTSFNTTGDEEDKYRIAGWGKLDYYKEKGSPTLQHALIQGIPLSDCSALQAEYVRPLDGTQVCAGSGQGRDACKGDSGGPLMFLQNKTGRVYQVGIVSFGSIPCGGRDVPSVYTRVSAYINWILKNMDK